jgi:ABC-type Mn2+/Zn2+ transport system permease subunit
VAALGGLALAFRLDTPVGPSIVVVAIGLFALAQGVRGRA